MRTRVIRIGCAGWAVPKELAHVFPAVGSHLERYAERFNAVEINSSFYRPHRRTTYERWAAAVPHGFAFAVKAPRTITHTRRLQNCESELEAFLSEATALGDKLGSLLFQLPPSLAYAEPEMAAFFELLRKDYSGSAVCEPRNASWFTAAADKLLRRFDIARAASDPAVVPAAAEPAGSSHLRYFRLHGSPRMYYSAYGGTRLAAIAAQLRASSASGAETWCIFDNTAVGAAYRDAFELQELLASLG